MINTIERLTSCVIDERRSPAEKRGVIWMCIDERAGSGFLPSITGGGVSRGPSGLGKRAWDERKESEPETLATDGKEVMPDGLI